MTILEILDVFIDHSFRACFIVAAAADIRIAIEALLSGNYFRFGLFAVLTVYMLLYIAKAVFNDVLWKEKNYGIHT